MELNNYHIRILKEMYDGYADDTVYLYSNLGRVTGFAPKVLRKNIRELRAAGLVQHVKGLIREDELGYYGSGHILTSAGADAIRPYSNEAIELPPTFVSNGFTWTNWLLGSNTNGTTGH